ncbi:hypothetical protein AMTRI_Chr09g13110 [Amborella trichopoda]|uniref:Uncharacterized protein n=1 Tax=Amborella trichopoda TaxID=13333 RepID=W1PN80_AMBTC|nr:photosynthetic NDH subunit of lumenal location 3, chloroplastic [Amborella trichopoda]XP_020524941.1 photosynthetic NDH subunit of lumenal location 3, chloroplastic [Amborella trichopoda]XP_020524942.1 photosynthetic NDH subunit of lumenal location 3, chloroplastic [Amborella trichopoda]ERN09523.1 hypothetical protein AMTR_s00029p00134930 [Amborella trichopoda]|eukprot:XP_006847942.1 photosynthetic NDH subunit of lumenal location 3, chloroplastic [Amborella trichopoda]
MDRKGSAIRIKKCAYDLLSIWDLIEEDQESWELVVRDLRLRSTFLYCDFNKLISSSSPDQKQALTDLANKLFSYIEQLAGALRTRSVDQTQNLYNDTVHVLEEVVALVS